MEANRKNAGTFFPFPGEKPENKKGIILRVLTSGKLAEIDEQTTEERNVVIDGVLYKDQVVTDPKKREEMRLDYLIVDWPGYTEDGHPVSCTAKNKVIYMNEDPVLNRFVTSKLGELQKLIDRQAGIERKNSSSAQRGSR